MTILGSMAYNNTQLYKMRKLLKNKPEARERKNKTRAIMHLIKRKYPSMKGIDPGVFQAAIKDASSLDRAWRKLLEEEPDLRGKDYEHACDKCSFVAKNEKGLHVHKGRIHKKWLTAVTCKVCGKQCGSLQGMLAHKRANHK